MRSKRRERPRPERGSSLAGRDRGVVACRRWPRCRQDMHNQPKYRGLRASAFFADGSSARPLVEGTVARGTLQTTRRSSPARSARPTVKELPFPVDEAGRSIAARSASTSTARRATTGPAAATAWSCSAATGSRRRTTSIGCGTADVGYFFDVMTNGFGAMPDYRAQISPRDRWDIVAYIRALQLSQHAAAADVPGRRSDQGPGAGSAGAGHGGEAR